MARRVLRFMPAVYRHKRSQIIILGLHGNVQPILVVTTINVISTMNVITLSHNVITVPIVNVMISTHRDNKV